MSKYDDPLNSNPYNSYGSKVVLYDDQGNQHIFIGNGAHHSHTVIAPNGMILFDRDARGNILTGNPPLAFAPPFNPFR